MPTLTVLELQAPLLLVPALSVLELRALLLFVQALSELARQALFFTLALSVLALQVRKAKTMARTL